MRIIISSIFFLILLQSGYTFGSANNKGEETMLFTIKRLKEIYLQNQSMPLEVQFKNESEYPIKLHKIVPSREKSLFRLEARRETFQKDEHSEKLTTLVDPSPQDLITLKPGEVYKDEINIAPIIEELNLVPGVYKIRLVYTMWVLMLKDKPEYIMDKEGKAKRDWISNEVEIKLADEELQDFLSKYPNADLNKDGILTQEEKSVFLSSIQKQKGTSKTKEKPTHQPSTPEDKDITQAKEGTTKEPKPEEQPPKETNHSTLHLKDGRTITGIITKEDPNTIKINTGVIEYTISKDEIDRIE